MLNESEATDNSGSKFERVIKVEAEYKPISMLCHICQPVSTISQRLLLS